LRRKLDRKKLSWMVDSLITLEAQRVPLRSTPLLRCRRAISEIDKWPRRDDLEGMQESEDILITLDDKGRKR